MRRRQEKRRMGPRCDRCGKLTAPTWAAAVTLARSLKRERGADPMEPYRCPHGAGFHLRTRTKAKARRGR